MPARLVAPDGNRTSSARLATRVAGVPRQLAPVCPNVATPATGARVPSPAGELEANRPLSDGAATDLPRLVDDAERVSAQRDDAERLLGLEPIAPVRAELRGAAPEPYSAGTVAPCRALPVSMAPLRASSSTTAGRPGSASRARAPAILAATERRFACPGARSTVARPPRRVSATAMGWEPRGSSSVPTQEPVGEGEADVAVELTTSAAARVAPSVSRRTTLYSMME